MSDSSIEIQNVRLKIHDNSDGTFSIVTYDLSGGTGVSDTSIEKEGFRIHCHDNNDGTFSPLVTSSTGVTDQAIEIQGQRIKIHPTGHSVTIGGIATPTYAIVTVSS